MKRYLSLSVIALIIMTFGSRLALADMSGDLSNMLNNYQTLSNYSVPGAYTGQTQGYVTGGSLAVRIPNTQLNPGITVTPPSIHGGCGGIDINLGGLSYLNPQQIVQKVQAVVANAAGTLFFLALQTLSPEIATVNDMMTKAADFMNGLNMNSCKAAQDLVNLGIDTVVSDSVQKCALQRLTNGQSSTMEDAKLACNQSPTNTGTSPTPGSQLDPTSNFTYMAILKYNYGSDPMIIQEILSLVGAVIYMPNPAGSDPPYLPRTFPPLINVKQLINGTDPATNSPQYPLYTCPNTAAQSPYTCTDMAQSGTPAAITGMTTVLNTILTNIYNKLANPYGGSASQLNTAELAFIQNTAVPIYRSLNILSANPSWGQSELPAIAQMTTAYFTKIYIEKVLNDIEAGLSGLKDNNEGIQLKKAMEYYADRKKEIEAELAQLPDNSPEKIFYVTQYLETYNTAMMQRLPKEIIANLSFARKIGGS
jgi:conjugative transfer pilus assembly protein TraH